LTSQNPGYIHKIPGSGTAAVTTNVLKPNNNLQRFLLPKCYHRL